MRPARPFEIFRGLKYYSEREFTLSAENPMTVEKGQRGVITRILDQAGNRKELLAWCFPSGEYPSERSSKTLSDSEWYALSKWLNPHKGDETWEPDVECWQEITWIQDQIRAEKNGMVGMAKKLGGVVRERSEE